VVVSKRAKVLNCGVFIIVTLFRIVRGAIGYKAFHRYSVSEATTRFKCFTGTVFRKRRFLILLYKRRILHTRRSMAGKRHYRSVMLGFDYQTAPTVIYLAPYLAFSVFSPMYLSICYAK
jgi:hypothetical protein